MHRRSFVRAVTKMVAVVKQIGQQSTQAWSRTSVFQVGWSKREIIVERATDPCWFASRYRPGTSCRFARPVNAVVRSQCGCKQDQLTRPVHIPLIKMIGAQNSTY